MTGADQPPPARARLEELAALRLGDALDDPIVQSLVDRAADQLQLPVAAVSILLDSAQYFIASRGLEGWIGAAQGTPGEWAFCRHTVDARAPFLVEDAGSHPVVRDNPLVRIDGIRCYLGIPLITSNDHAIGTLCVLGDKTRAFSASEVETLRELAGRVMTNLETRRVAL
ncbi:GGDEF domain protein [Enhygromyxa salina]|uniref:GGDEF domain protein n=1 Tax=Enhygromyxa salina TaxID=215803 RepID=A0A0C2CTR3_9BACT|nr:GAF domain-containing protein [Enhygromyxa salina]KIG13015.1 GGDEF domain protein [Enhygromyxa salina]